MEKYDDHICDGCSVYEPSVRKYCENNPHNSPTRLWLERELDEIREELRIIKEELKNDKV